MKRPPLKLIEWEDAYNGNHGWCDPEGLPAEPPSHIVHTLGFEIRRTPDRVVLAMSWHSDDEGGPASVCDLFTIPVGMIRRERTLADPR